MKILVAVDGSPASLRAVKLAICQVKAVAGSGLILVNVQNLLTLGLPEGAGIMPRAWIEQEEARAAAEALQGAIAGEVEAGEGIGGLAGDGLGGVAGRSGHVRERLLHGLAVGRRADLPTIGGAITLAHSNGAA